MKSRREYTESIFNFKKLSNKNIQERFNIIKDLKTPFTGARIARVQGSDASVDVAIAKWDDSLKKPFVVFDPTDCIGSLKILEVYLKKEVETQDKENTETENELTDEANEKNTFKDKTPGVAVVINALNGTEIDELLENRFGLSKSDIRELGKVEPRRNKLIELLGDDAKLE